MARARAGGLGGLFFALFADPAHYRGEAAWRRTLALLDAVEAAVAARPRRIAAARTAADVRAHHATGRIAALLGVEGAHGLGAGSERRVLSRLNLLARRGVRYLGLTWNNSNALAGAAVDGGGGLTALGRRVVRECERLGVLVDVSHSSDATVRDVLRVARHPLLASHSNARALCDVPRNLPDDLLRAVGAGGGVVCVNFFGGFLEARVSAEIKRGAARLHSRGAPALPPDAGKRLAAERRAALSVVRHIVPPRLSVVVRHVEHVARVAGPGAVGLGSDFDGMWLPPAGLEDVAAYPRLARALARRFTSAAVRDILGGNLLRLLEAAEPA